MNAIFIYYYAYSNIVLRDIFPGPHSLPVEDYYLVASSACFKTSQ